jgi:16S rRNA (uracil1498-N3)-methyltransferase
MVAVEIRCYPGSMSERYFLEQPLALGPVTVAGPEAHHLANVCRVREGEIVVLFNGDGRQYRAVVGSAGKRAVELNVTAIEEPHRELGCRLVIAAPLPKGDRAQFLVEKLTELGVTEFVPLRTERSVVHPRDVDKHRRHVIEASKQCGRNVLMRVAPLTDWSEWTRNPTLPALRYLAHFGGDETVRFRGENIALTVGPEGGFTDDEIALARNAGWGVVGLGARVLRVETAAIVLAVLATQIRLG